MCSKKNQIFIISCQLQVILNVPSYVVSDTGFWETKFKFVFYVSGLENA